MSTKTNFKRVALVAVAALGLGVLTSVAPANAALVSGNIYDNVSTGAATAVGSIGLLGADGTTALAQTATLLSTGTIAVGGYENTINTAQNITVTGGTITLVSNTGAGTPGAVTIDGTTLAKATAAADASDENILNVAIKPNAGATSMTINFYDGATTTAAVKRIIVTIATTSTYNKFSAADSTVYWGAGAGADTAITDATSTNSKKANGSTLAGDVSLYDEYGNFLSATAAGVLTATVSSGAVVNLGSNSVAGSSNVDFNAGTGAVIPFNVQQATANVGVNVTVSFAWNGVVFATKSGVIGGEVAKVTILAPKIGTTGGANATSAVVQYEDSLGNAVYPASGTSAVGATLGAVVSAITPDYGTDNATDPTYLAWTCSTAGTAKGLQIKHLNASGTVVTSNAVDAGCAGVSTSVTGSWDKASYAPGTIATLSLTFKDSKGNLASAFENIGGDDNANSIMTITGAPSTAAVTPVALTDKPSGITGTKTYQFVVGTTEGDFIAVVVPTEVKANNPLATNLSLPYSVKATSAGVTNADVLKAIVSLIASINKQIAALQKALLKK